MIRTAGFVRNSCIRHWMDNRGVGQYNLSALCAALAKEYEWAKKLNSQARQASAERAWQSIKRFYDNCKNPAIKKKRSADGEETSPCPRTKKSYPRFKKSRSVEYKTTGCQLPHPKGMGLVTSAKPLRLAD